MDHGRNCVERDSCWTRCWSGERAVLTGAVHDEHPLADVAGHCSLGVLKQVSQVNDRVLDHRVGAGGLRKARVHHRTTLPVETHLSLHENTVRPAHGSQLLTLSEKFLPARRYATAGASRVSLSVTSQSSVNTEELKTADRIELVFGMDASSCLALFCKKILVSPK